MRTLWPRKIVSELAEESVADLYQACLAKRPILDSIGYLRTERNRLLGLSHQQALDELLRLAGLDSRIAKVEGIEHGSLLGVDGDE